MNRSLLWVKRSWVAGLIFVAVEVTYSCPTLAQVSRTEQQHSDGSLPLCYMRLANGSFMDLHTLCGRSTPTETIQLIPSNSNQPPSKPNTPNAQTIPANATSPPVIQAEPGEPSGVNIEY